MSENELRNKSAKELKALCKEMGIPHYEGKTCIRKDLMVERILQKLNGVVEPKETKTEEPVVTEPIVEEPKVWENKDKTIYIEEAEVGTLIAFYDEKRKPRTAALVNRSSNRKVIKVVTEFEREFIVPYENVLWVKRGTRWPRGVYEILKGYHKNGKENSEG